MTEQRVITGRIIKVSKAGWGFISSREIEFTRIFFHWTSLTQATLSFTELRTGMIVEFTPVQIPTKGYRAIRVTVTDTRGKHDSEPDMSPLPELGSEDDVISDINSTSSQTE